MNVREGARRLGIVLGVLGGTAGVFAGYPSARDLWNARAASKKFESLMASPTMRKVAKAAKERFQNDPWEKYRVPGPQSVEEIIAEEHVQNVPHGTARLDDIVGPAEPEAPLSEIDTTIDGKRRKIVADIPDAATLAQTKSAARQYLRANPAGGNADSQAAANFDGIEEVMVDKGVVQLIRLVTGASVQRTEPPALKSYFSLLLYPILGSILPWGAIRALTWLGAGFFEPNRL
jgi:hypothetical protein